MDQEEMYWTQRYLNLQTGWDVGFPTPPITEFLDKVDNRDISLLFPGAGNGYEVEYAYRKGFRNTYILDISKEPLRQFQQRFSDFPLSQVIHEDFFNHQGQYDLIIEQTFFCSLIPTEENRSRYAQKMKSLLREGGMVVGVLFDFPLAPSGKRPFGGDQNLYHRIFSPIFNQIYIQRCYNSIPDREGLELFFIFQ